jgi:hypothetical protein
MCIVCSRKCSQYPVLNTLEYYQVNVTIEIALR